MRLCNDFTGAAACTLETADAAETARTMIQSFSNAAAYVPPIGDRGLPLPADRGCPVCQPKLLKTAPDGRCAILTTSQDHGAAPDMVLDTETAASRAGLHFAGLKYGSTCETWKYFLLPATIFPRSQPTTAPDCQVTGDCSIRPDGAQVLMPLAAGFCTTFCSAVSVASPASGSRYTWYLHHSS